MIREINIHNVMDILRGVVGENEDYVDPKGASAQPCKYTPSDDYPGCLIGQAYKSLGAGDSELEAMDEYGLISDVGDNDLCPIHTTLDAISVMQKAQEQQDAGHTWGQALMMADAEYDYITRGTDV